MTVQPAWPLHGNRRMDLSMQPARHDPHPFLLADQVAARARISAAEFQTAQAAGVAPPPDLWCGKGPLWLMSTATSWLTQRIVQNSSPTAGKGRR